MKICKKITIIKTNNYIDQELQSESDTDSNSSSDSDSDSNIYIEE